MCNDVLNHGEQRNYYTTTTYGSFKFVGVHRKDLESENWRYYDRGYGLLMHFRKEHMVAVQEGPIDDQDTSKS